MPLHPTHPLLPFASLRFVAHPLYQTEERGASRTGKEAKRPAGRESQLVAGVHLLPTVVLPGYETFDKIHFLFNSPSME